MEVELEDDQGLVNDLEDSLGDDLKDSLEESEKEVTTGKSLPSDLATWASQSNTTLLMDC